jgi:hypothetical protein
MTFYIITNLNEKDCKINRLFGTNSNKAISSEQVSSLEQSLVKNDLMHAKKD